MHWLDMSRIVNQYFETRFEPIIHHESTCHGLMEIGIDAYCSMVTECSNNAVYQSILQYSSEMQVWAMMMPYVHKSKAPVTFVFRQHIVRQGYMF